MVEKKRTALVTGGSRGIGKAICKRLASEGINIVVGYNHNKERAAKLVDELEAMGVKAAAFQGSVENIYEVKKVFRQTLEQFGSLDILVNNAGITADKTLVKMGVEVWLRVIQINLCGTYHCCHEALQSMLPNGYGRIINVSSIIGLTGNIGQSNYAASKAGVIGFTKSLALEVATKGVTANVVAPGFIETEMTRKIPPEIYRSIEAKIPMKRFGTVEEVARLVSFLAADESAYITGQVYGINGGLYM
ncbi:MAG: 3-oxoacyl-[acyl-carrier-protein] reductase [Desulfobacca sp. 4484_104]|nr:MAG: 3-oxoacyl-[acyl-carrier-protein] reductase [Desulfobacca sp. 4484_104]RLB66523.1 MAG: 3-oxoacyl-[acyl-carrier-protein] reductase [Deltaproteobacteria bacterium]